jgi:hypothetical protein
MELNQNYWKRCSSCKKEIPFSAMYYVCSVSTCKHPRKGFTFCSVPCWDSHLGDANHRESWAEEQRSPSQKVFLQEQDHAKEILNRQPQRKIVDNKIDQVKSSYSAGIQTINDLRTDSDYNKLAKNIKTETLVVVSKVKQLILEQSGFKTSQCCIDALTIKVVEESLKAIENAKKAGRLTVMGRDVKNDA